LVAATTAVTISPSAEAEEQLSNLIRFYRYPPEGLNAHRHR
jgi:hypothetical protein